MGFALFLLIVSGILLAFYGYISTRLVADLGLSGVISAALWLLSGLLAMAPAVSILLRNLNRWERCSEILAWAGYLGLGFVSLAATLLLLRDLAWLLVKGLQLAMDSLGQRFSPASELLARRHFLFKSSTLGLTGLAALLATRGFRQARRIPEVVRVRVPIAGLPPELAGLRIAQISDIHAGPTVKQAFVRSVVEEVNGLRPDLVAFTGDLADGSVSHVMGEVDALRLLEAPLGRFFVTGNHEYYSGVLGWIAVIERLGFTVLNNEYRVVTHNGAALLVAGVTDIDAGRFIPSHASDPRKALEGAPEVSTRLLLAHQPNSIHGAARAGFDLQLSGHTHGGQFFPWNYAAAGVNAYLKGLHLHEGTWIYVNRGTGYWGPPLRLGDPGEITLIELAGS